MSKTKHPPQSSVQIKHQNEVSKSKSSIIKSFKHGFVAILNKASLTQKFVIRKMVAGSTTNSFPIDPTNCHSWEVMIHSFIWSSSLSGPLLSSCAQGLTDLHQPWPITWQENYYSFFWQKKNWQKEASLILFSLRKFPEPIIWRWNMR